MKTFKEYKMNEEFDDDIKTGDKVRMSNELINQLIISDCEDHAREFGDCIGVVEDTEYEDGEDKEVNVRWSPSKLRYSYNTKHLVKVE